MYAYIYIYSNSSDAFSIVALDCITSSIAPAFPAGEGAVWRDALTCHGNTFVAS